jgi:hypothetical protein
MAHPETCRWEWRRNRPGSRERPDRLCHCSRSELFRHLSRLCARSVGARHRHCLKTPSTGEILPCHKAVQLQSQHAQPRRVPCHVSPLLPRPASGLHRLPPAARHRHGRHGSPPFPLSGQRHAGLPAERARSRTHPQPRILLSWRHRSL